MFLQRLKTDVKLVPVIELAYNTPGISTPDNWPYWKYPAEWDDYHRACFLKAGFPDTCIPFEPGSHFYEIHAISDGNLKRIVLDHTEGQRAGDYEEFCPLYGGFVLQIDGENLFYPQCCGDLGDIQFWRNTCNGAQSFYEGHPRPKVSFTQKQVIFDLTTREHDEYFVPSPKKEVFRFDRNELIKAVAEAEVLLQQLADRIEAINRSENLGIPSIGEKLVWFNENYR